MKMISKKRKEIVQKLDLSKKYDPKEAIQILKNNSYVKFNETLDLAIKLSIDTSKTDQNIRGIINLPHGTGKNIKVAVMAKGDKAKEAKDAGAAIVGETLGFFSKCSPKGWVPNVLIQPFCSSVLRGTMVCANTQACLSIDKRISLIKLFCSACKFFNRLGTGP